MPEKKKPQQRHGFRTNEYVVYPAHGVGRIVSIEEQEIAGVNSSCSSSTSKRTR